ncbi:hypothetical protein ANN_18593 [Periplaneta americana]|uniref:Uncharacterized protein n=1 Tax=Periplaneta americana TaxID=6978 RepID=A0ABQ8SP68_PERAM|nr:hypothetical protein ANN_18593 [Periplaneta americana]
MRETCQSLDHAEVLGVTDSLRRRVRHSTINDIIKRALTSSGIPAILEPIGISRTDVKRPDGLTLVPWSRRKSLLWDTTCVDTLAPSHLPSTSKIASSAAESAVRSKRHKYLHPIDNSTFIVFAVETIGFWCKEAKDLVSEIGRSLVTVTGDPHCTNYYCKARLTTLYRLMSERKTRRSSPSTSLIRSPTGVVGFYDAETSLSAVAGDRPLPYRKGDFIKLQRPLILRLPDFPTCSLKSRDNALPHFPMGTQTYTRN